VPHSQNHKEFRILVPVGNQAQIAPLLTFCCSLARSQGGRVTLMAVTADGQQPDWLLNPETPLKSRSDGGYSYDGIEVDSIVRFGHHAGGAILAVVREISPQLLVLGWSGAPGSGRYMIGSTLDPLVQKAPCDIVVLRIGDEPEQLVDGLNNVRKVLVPMRRGDNAAMAVDLALQLSPDAQVTALNIAQLGRGRAGVQLGREQLAATLDPWAENERVQPKVVQAPGIVGGILNEAKTGYDLLFIGASHESYIDRMLFGNVPQTVAMQSPVPTIVVKRSGRWEENIVLRTRQRFINAWPTLTVAERADAYRTVRRGARPDADFFVMIGLSATIATLGLLLNSAAVIIGAMLVAPLMSAIIGLGLGVVQGDWRLLRLAAGATARGMLLAVAVATLIAWIVPGAAATGEISGRTHPYLYDLGVALASGAAGAYALCRRDVSASLPGVAIAAALVPPLAVMGIGIALWDGGIAGGALLLFLTNLIAISAAGGLVFLALGFRPELRVQARARVFAGGVVGVVVLLLAVTVPLGALTLNSIREAAFNRTLETVLEEEIAAMDRVELLDWSITQDDSETLHLELEVRASRQPSHQSVVDLQKRVASRLQRTVALRLTVIPITQLDPFVPPTFTPTVAPTAVPTGTPTATPTSSLDPDPNAAPTLVPSVTNTPGDTPTPIAISTATSTPTPIPTITAEPTGLETSAPVPTATATTTPTPSTGLVQDTGGRGLRLREAPGGQIIRVLEEGDAVVILNGREAVENVEWIEVQDLQGQIGWVASQYVVAVP
jgi:uncharacterized hydrophobic protein (TIGR00271 family)